MKRKPPKPEKAIAVFRALEDRCKSKAENRGRGYDMSIARMGDLNRLFAARFGGTEQDFILPDTPEGRNLVRFALAHHAEQRSPARRMANWIRKHCPWMSKAEVAEQVAASYTNPKTYSMTKLGKLLKLEEEERRQTRITSIYACDVTPAESAARTRAGRNARRRARRAAQGAKSHADSLSRTKPWVAEGMSRRQWYYRKKQRALEAENLDKSTRCTNLVRTYHEMVHLDRTISVQTDAFGQDASTGAGRALDGAPGDIPERDIAASERDIPPGFRDIACHTQEDASTVQGRALNGAPTLRAGRVKAVAVVPSRAGWTREKAMLLEGNSEAKGGHQARPFAMFPDSDQGETGPMAMAAWVLPPAWGAGPPPREISICNIFLQGGA